MRSTRTPKQWFQSELDANCDTPEFELEWLLLDLEENISRAMRSKNISRSELAERLGTSRAFVTKLLSGHENLTLRTLVRVANALETKIDLRLVPRESRRRPAAVGRTSPTHDSAKRRTPPSRRSSAVRRLPVAVPRGGRRAKAASARARPNTK